MRWILSLLTAGVHIVVESGIRLPDCVDRIPAIIDIRKNISDDVKRLGGIIRRYEETCHMFAVDEIVDEYNRQINEYRLFSYMQQLINGNARFTVLSMPVYTRRNGLVCTTIPSSTARADSRDLPVGTKQFPPVSRWTWHDARFYFIGVDRGIWTT